MKDLVEYFLKWPSEREKIMALAESERVSENEKRSLLNMIFVIDRVGPNDLEYRDEYD